MTPASPKSFRELVGFELAPIGVPHETHGTTVIALRYKGGVLTLADRRATMGNLIMFDHAEKILALDDSTVLAISGSFARSIEAARFLKHGFKYYRRMVISELSLEGKLMEISRVLASNVQMAMQGIGVFLPIVSAYDRSRGQFGVFFFDGAGARFENSEYACAGSGAERIRGVFEYLSRTRGPWNERPLDEVLVDGLTMLDIAADLDSATGGFGKTLPAAQVLEKDGTWALDPEKLQSAAAQVLGRPVV